MRCFESCGYDFALDFLEGAEAGDRAGGACGGGSNTLWKIFWLEEVALGRRGAAVGTRENHSALKCVAEFADIAWPGVGREHPAHRITQLRIRAAVNRTKGH